MCRKTDNLKWWALCDTCLSKSSSLKVYFIARCPYLLNVLHRHFCYLMQIAVLEMWRYSGWRTEEDQILFLKILSPVLFIVCGAHHPCHKSMEVITILSISPLKLCRFPEANWHRKMVCTKLHIWHVQSSVDYEASSNLTQINGRYWSKREPIIKMLVKHGNSGWRAL